MPKFISEQELAVGGRGGLLSVSAFPALSLSCAGVGARIQVLTRRPEALGGPELRSRDRRRLRGAEGSLPREWACSPCPALRASRNLSAYLRSLGGPATPGGAHRASFQGWATEIESQGGRGPEGRVLPARLRSLLSLHSPRPPPRPQSPVLWAAIVNEK